MSIRRDADQFKAAVVRAGSRPGIHGGRGIGEIDYIPITAKSPRRLGAISGRDSVVTKALALIDWVLQ